MKLLLLALISFASQVTATPTCDNCNTGLTKVGGTGCYCGKGVTKGTTTTPQVFVAKTQYCDTTFAATGTALTTPKCASTDGSTKPTATCSCGSLNVQVLKTEYCFVAADKKGAKHTAARVACVDSTGSTKNSVAAGCYCGSTAVVVLNNQFCDTALAATGVMMTTAKCTGSSGTTKATATCSCGTDKKQVAINEYCYVATNKKGFKSTTADIACTSTDGSTAFTHATNKCYCGPNSLVIANNKICNVYGDVGYDFGTVPKRTCASTDGSTKQGTGVTCDCGSNGVDVTQGNKCFVKADKTGVSRADIPVCTTTDGSLLDTTATNPSCICGTNGVIVTNAEFCDVGYVATGVGLTKKKCTGSNGSTVEGAACSCGKNSQDCAQTTGFCFVATGTKTGFVSASALKVACVDTTGTSKNTVTVGCYCGTSAESIANNEYCDTTLVATGSKLTSPRCTATAATANPAVQCTCGQTGTGTQTAAGPTVTTKQYCFVKANGVGAMYTTAISAATTCDSTACTPSNNVAIVTACKCASGSTSNECAAAQYCWVGNTCNAKSNGANTAFHGLLAFAGAAFAASLIVV